MWFGTVPPLAYHGTLSLLFMDGIEYRLNEIKQNLQHYHALHSAKGLSLVVNIAFGFNLAALAVVFSVDASDSWKAAAVMGTLQSGLISSISWVREAKKIMCEARILQDAEDYRFLFQKALLELPHLHDDAKATIQDLLE